MSRHELRNRYPWHRAAQQCYASHQPAPKPYNRHSLRHRLRALRARFLLLLGRN